MTERRRHPVIFERAGRIQPFILQKQTPWFHIDIFSHSIVLLQDSLPFADGYFIFIFTEAQQLAESPDAGKIQQIISGRPALGKFA
ncbi:hypothetical protein ES703_124642 [subsurface metagenome]